MEGHFSQGGNVPGGAAYGGFDLQGSMRIHHPSDMIQHQALHGSHPESSVHPFLPEAIPFTMATSQTCDQNMLMPDFKGKISFSDEDTEEGGDGHTEANNGIIGSPWHRVKWTDNMVELLITAVSYIGEESTMEGGMRRKFAALQKKGKWKSVSTVMAERGYHVSPQQCEDKFNDLNKRYKKLNDMIGRGTTCQVVANPALLDVIDYLTEKEKDDVRKILNSKHLFYEEMCSYHNNNRLHLPRDPALQHSLRLALRIRDDNHNDNDDAWKHQNGDIVEEGRDMEVEEGHYDGEGHHLHPLLTDSRGMHHHHHGGAGSSGNASTRFRQEHSLEDVKPQGEGSAAWVKKQWVESRSLQLEEQKLLIQAQMLELEKQRFKWQRFTKKKDEELEKMKMENEKMKLENEQMELELKRIELRSSDL